MRDIMKPINHIINQLPILDETVKTIIC